MTDTQIQADKKTTHEGGCHCGAVRFRVRVDLHAGTTRCNCTFCTKTAGWGVHVKPADFELLAGRESLADYRHGAATTNLHFCKVCGVRPFSHGDAPWMGGEYHSVNLNCLDDQSALGGLPVRWFDGRHDDWETTRDERSPAPWP